MLVLDNLVCIYPLSSSFGSSIQLLILETIPSLKLAFDASNLRDAVYSVRISARSLRSAVTYYKVQSRHVKML